MNNRDRAPAPGNNRPQRKQQQQQQQQSSRKRGQGRKQPQTRQKAIPAAYRNVTPNSAPKIRMTGKTCSVSHSEFFHDVLGTVSGHFIKHTISPSSTNVFPWLSGMAGNFESYRFNMLRFRYKNRVGTLVGGTFAMAPDYDCNDAFPATKGDLLTYDDRADSAPYEPCSLTCSKYNLNKRASYFTGTVPVGKDPNLYNVGNLYMYTGGNPDAGQIGELFVEYDITFSTPQAQINAFPNGRGGGFFGTSNVAPFGSEYTLTNLTSSGTLLVPSTTGTTTSATTFTWASAWKGWITVNFVGTGLTPIAESGTAGRIPLWAEVGTATGITGAYQVSAGAGETLTLTIGNTTITRADIVFGNSPNAGA